MYESELNQENALNSDYSTGNRAASVLLHALVGCSTFFGMSTAWAQKQQDTTIAAVEFTGLKRTSEAFARDIVRIRGGDAFDRASLDEAATRLLRTGRFQTAQFRTEESPDGVRVTFEVVERVVVTAIRFEGNAEFREGTLKSEVSQKINEPVDWFKVRDGRDAIIRKYHEAGYSDVSIEFDQAHVEQTGELVFKIHERLKVRIREIVFEGNATFGDKVLKKEIETKTAWWIFRTGAFDKELAEGDVARLQNYYRDQGFLDATASYATSVGDDGHDMTVTFTVQEGTRYRIEDIQFVGHAVFSADELLNMTKSRVGEIVKRPQVDADVKAIQDRYGELGYIYARVRSTRVFSDAPGLVRLTIDIEEGEQFRVGRVAVRGNARTRDKVVRRALNLFPPDDLFNLTEAREAEKRLVETRIFSSARVLPVGDQPGVRDAVIDVVEAEKAGDFLFGLGVTSNSGLVGSVVLDLQNFDIFDTPRSWSEFFKLRSFYGGGQRMRIELQPGSQVNRFRIDFTEPYLFDKPIRYDTSLFLFERGRDGYHENRLGTTSSLGKRFESGPMQGWSGEIAFRSELVEIDNIDIFSAHEIREDKGSNLINGVKGTLVRDRTDNRFVPSAGDRLRISYEQVGLLGGDHQFGRLGLGYNWYKTLSVDRQERKRVLSLRGEGGIIIGDAPVFERFYAGGIGSVRGFAYRGIGERSGLDDNNIGGDYLLLAGAEYSYPLYGENLRGHVFLETGTAGSGAYRAAVGTGVRFTINVFGPLPLEFNLAMPVAKGDGDDEQIFSFTIGSLF